MLMFSAVRELALEAGGGPYRSAPHPSFSSRPLTPCPEGGGRPCGAQRRLLGVDVGQPPVGIRDLAVDHGEECLLERLGDRTASAGANLLLVDRSDRRDFG